MWGAKHMYLSAPVCHFLVVLCYLWLLYSFWCFSFLFFSLFLFFLYLIWFRAPNLRWLPDAETRGRPVGGTSGLYVIFAKERLLFLLSFTLADSFLKPWRLLERLSFFYSEITSEKARAPRTIATSAWWSVVKARSSSTAGRLGQLQIIW